MSNIIEYVNQMEHVSFKDIEFNEVDSLVLSQLSYLDFSAIDTHNIQTLSEIADHKKLQQMTQHTWNPKDNLRLLSEVSNSLRFGSIQIIDLENILSEEKQQQFSAVTFKLDESLYYIAYRGTDATIIGWKEDFNMSYQEIIPSQISAVQYFEKILTLYPGRYFLGGHSKGGNLATFSGAFSNFHMQQYIIAVYNHDGPGFHQSIIESEQYQKIINKIYKTVPEFSIIGVLLEEAQNFKVVKSKSIGVFQHDPFTWEIVDTQFVTENSISTISLLTQNTILTWIKTMDTETKRSCLDSVYTIVASTGAIKLNDLKNINPENIKLLTLSIKRTDKKIKRQWVFVTKLFIKISITEGIHLAKRNT